MLLAVRNTKIILFVAFYDFVTLTFVIVFQYLYFFSCRGNIALVSRQSEKPEYPRLIKLCALLCSHQHITALVSAPSLMRTLTIGTLKFKIKKHWSVTFHLLLTRLAFLVSRCFVIDSVLFCFLLLRVKYHALVRGHLALLE